MCNSYSIVPIHFAFTCPYFTAELLLDSKILTETAYQKQQDTLIVWSENDSFDYALSFQEKAGCDDIWEKICLVIKL